MSMGTGGSGHGKSWRITSSAPTPGLQRWGACGLGAEGWRDDWQRHVLFVNVCYWVEVNDAAFSHTRNSGYSSGASKGKGKEKDKLMPSIPLKPQSESSTVIAPSPIIKNLDGQKLSTPAPPSSGGDNLHVPDNQHNHRPNLALLMIIWTLPVLDEYFGVGHEMTTLRCLEGLNLEPSSGMELQVLLVEQLLL
ncbi:uncharacterized protein EI90DRAFT_3123363 [Cantharellus anzutake]|uniref:uncharacterized protein n=1 Tax=Cantharellus anzutake TaxID=1750568 RepID=UPI0019062B46|nr:uncharacterized protein EI90DRAFT_3123363 [Cantharellus anzutake]KAF8331736.1 hypothetical protein EI90DRAFT_3123363 [Cantharellus anzutake]